MKKYICYFLWAILLSLNSYQVVAQVTNNVAKRVIKYTGAPSNPQEGDIYYNLSTHKAYIYNGSSFIDITSGGGTPGGSSGTIQYNNSGAFGGITGSSVSGANITLGGTTTIPTGALKILDTSNNGFGFSVTHGGPLFFNNTAGFSFGINSSAISATRTYIAPDQNGTITVLGNSNLATSITGNSATATALAANGTNCSAGSFPLGVDASGNSESCTVASTVSGTGTLNTFPKVTNATGPVYGDSGITESSTATSGVVTINGQVAIKETSKSTSLLSLDLRATSANNDGIYWDATWGTVFKSFGGDALAINRPVLMALSGGVYGFTSSSTVVKQSADSGTVRIAAGVVGSGDGGSNNNGWFTDRGHSFLASDGTTTSASLASTGLSITVTNARKYSFVCEFFLSDSVAADGAVIDFGGGSATSTNFRAQVTAFDTALNLSTQLTSLTGTATASTFTGAGAFEVHGSFEPSSTGTFIPRYAQNAHTTGTLTLARGSYCKVWDMN